MNSISDDTAISPAVFDREAWNAKLAELNPWWPEKLTLKSLIDNRHDDSPFKRERKRACLDRWKEGRDAWNDWAKAMWSLREEAAENASPELKLIYSAYSAADLAGHKFELAMTDREVPLDLQRGHYFEGFLFPGPTIFRGAKFGDKEHPTVARFKEAEFKDDVCFDGAEFFGWAIFRDARFKSGSVSFVDTRFIAASARKHERRIEIYQRDESGRGIRRDETPLFVDFRNVQFSGSSVSFESAEFIAEFLAYNTSFEDVEFSSRRTEFLGARFRFPNGEAIFRSSRFAHSAYFGQTTWLQSKSWVEFDCTANFVNAVFEGPAIFDKACFNKSALFSSIQSKVCFSLAGAKFTEIPDFMEATFHEAPRLDNIDFDPPFLQRRSLSPKDMHPPIRKLYLRWFRIASDQNVHARLRKLRSMASEGKDAENELRFNAYEMRARRFWVDRPWPLRSGAGRFWLGLVFDKLSNFGQSSMRPLLAWLAMMVLFAVVYMTPLSGRIIDPVALNFAKIEVPTWLAPVRALDHCYSNVSMEQVTGAVWQAFALSLRNSIILDRSDASRRMYGCLYGLEKNAANPVIPLAVMYWSTVQSLISALLIFLFGLGLRNMFRLK